MKHPFTVIAAALLLLALLALPAWLLFAARGAPVPGAPPELPQTASAPSEPARLEAPPAVASPDPTEALAAKLDRVLARLEKLERTVSEVRTEISIRSEERSRISVPSYAGLQGAKLSEEDLAAVRTIVEHALVQEAWNGRQDEIVRVGRHLAHELPIETRKVDPLIEVLCATGLAQFQLERELSAENHDSSLARRRVPDFRNVRRRLRDDLGSLLRNDELAARIFLHVASFGEVPSLTMAQPQLQALEKDWLR
jgi:hypothetical protein